MTGFRALGGRIIMRMPFLIAVLTCYPASALPANDITGYVQNRTREVASVGDEVILLRLDQGMQEEAHTVTGAQGAFALKAQFLDKRYLVRVIHQGVDYDQQISPGNVVFIDVFDAAPNVDGIAGTIEIIRAATTNGNLLHVSDLYEIRNDSRPPLTLVGERTLEVHLALSAKIDSVLAAGPANTPANVSAQPVRGEPGHYAVNFPLRPGATKFAFNYDLPYNGRATFQSRLVYSVQQLAVMVPRGITFSSRSRLFRILSAGNPRYEVHAANNLKAGQELGFEVSGTGPLPEIRNPSPSVGRKLPALHEPAVSTSHQDPALTRKDLHTEQSRQSSPTLVLLSLTGISLFGSALLVWRFRNVQNFCGKTDA